jgi:NADH-quinone oxidoreductase subunit G
MTKQLVIDGKLVEVDDDVTLMQACELAGAEIPRFCYHERLSIAGNCRMCLVEVAGAPKPIASCAMTVRDLPPNKDGSPKAISTRSELVKKAREGVMEFLLINHPLDCPICDQGGECDLQDQAMAYGVGGSRYDENKRAVEDKYVGPLIKTIMTRCIHCTRCVRYMTEVAGVEELGLIGRGEDAEITTYLEKGILSEMSGNVIDLCPVGALTHRPWAFIARPWELTKTESFDVMDAVGSSIRVDSRGGEVLRVLPRNNDAVNEEWISDKTRHVADGLDRQRLDRPYVRREGRLQPATWDEALAAVAERLTATTPNRIGLIAGDLAGAEEMFAAKDLFDRLGVHNVDCRQDGSKLDTRFGRAGYLLNSTIEGIEQADAILLIGTNPRLEAPVINSRIRKRWREGAVRIANIGAPYALTYDYDQLGETADCLAQIAAGTHPFADVLKKAQAPMVIVGQGALARPDGADIWASAAKAAFAAAGGKSPRWKVFNVLHTAAARVASFDLGLLPGDEGHDMAGMMSAAEAGQLDVVYLLGADEFNTEPLADAFVIYQGSHGDAGANAADVILPGAAFTEKSATYCNTEGRVQMTLQSVFPPGEAKEDWKILRALSSRVGHTLPYDDVEQLRQAMYQSVPHLAALDTIAPSRLDEIRALAEQAAAELKGPLQSNLKDFYLTNPIARASPLMAELSALKAASDKTSRLAAAE